MSRDEDFTAFATLHSARLLRLAMLMTQRRDVAEDAVQESLSRVYVAWARISDPERYATRALVNEVRGRWRLGQRRPEVLVGDTFPDPGSPDRTHRFDDRDELSRALALLPTAQRLAIVLRHVEDLSERETARLLGCSIGTVKSSTSRGLARLRELMTPEPTTPRRPL